MDCGGAHSIRAIGKEAGEVASSCAGGVRILHIPNHWPDGVPTTKSESRCPCHDRSIESVRLKVGRHGGSNQMTNAKPHGKRPLDARRLSGLFEATRRRRT